MNTLGAIIVWAVFGLVVGAIARLLYPGRQPMGFFGTVALGIVGSLIGGGISWLFAGGSEARPFEPGGWILSILGALVLIGISYALSDRRRTV